MFNEAKFRGSRMSLVESKLKQSRPRWQRVPLAFIHSVSALFKQFRWSVLMFVLVTIVGGYFYGELHSFSGRDAIAMIDRPYMMLQLMILSTPVDYMEAPQEWYLVIFWYTLPLVFVFIIGNGVADFVRLFFGDTWHKVRISNYQNHIIVLGAGLVGLRVVRCLREWGEQVVIVDHNLHLSKRNTLHELKVGMIEGDARHHQTLQDANIAEADAFIACTGDDAVNLYSTMRARAANPDVQIVMRVWDDSFSQQIDQFIVHSQQANANGIDNTFTSVLSSSEIAAPIFAGLALGIELTQTLSIGGNDYGGVRLMVKKGSSLADKTIRQIQEDNHVDVVLHQSSTGQLSVRPARELIVNVGDTLVLFAEHLLCIDIAQQNNRTEELTGSIVVLGAGHVGLRVIRLLLTWGVQVVAVDNQIEPDVREALEEMLNADHALQIIEADGREQKALEMAGIREATAFVACTGDDPTNLYAIMRARAMNPDMQIVIRVWDDSFNEQINQFIIRKPNDAMLSNTISAVRSSSNLSATIFAGRSLGIDLTQALIVHDPKNGEVFNYVAVRLEVKRGSFLSHSTVNDIQQASYLGGKSADVVVYCSGDTQPQILPERNTKVRAGDTLVIFAELDVCIDIAKCNQRRRR
jgi:Trk K+ transport system NAD-binding subunit